jgi:hypothetical protein
LRWRVEFHSAFVPEYRLLPETVQNELQAILLVLEQWGPQLGRPRVDTLKGSRHPNMKELRFMVPDGVYRFAFAFDPARRAIVLCGGNKSGVSQERFYRQLVSKADKRFDAHLAAMKLRKEKS